MSEEKVLELERQLSRLLNVSVSSLIVVVIAAFGFGGWCATLEIRARESTTHIEESKVIRRDYETFRTVSEQNRYTATDAVRQSLVVQASLTEHDKRVTRLEDSVTQVKNSLGRIEDRLGTKCAVDE